MDAKLIEDARAWVRTNRTMLAAPGGSAGPSLDEWRRWDEVAFAIVRSLAELPLEGDDL